MLLQSNQSIMHINSITHEGKVVLLGTSSAGKIYYTVKQDGYENNYNSETGWEDWRELEFPDEEDDSSVVGRENKELTYKSNPSNFIIRSLYKSKDKSVVAPVQIVSASGHLYVFRQSNSNTLLVDRFVLDELTNNLGRKIEVRYKRSRKRYEPWEGNGNTQGNGISSFDSLNYRDTDGNPFYEPTTEITVVNNLHNGWFSVVLLPTNELDKYRWHIFAYNSDSGKVELISIRASEDGLFDVKDYTVFDPKPGEPEFLIPRQIPGIIRRSLDLKDKNGEVLEVVNGLSATKYDTQVESVTQGGETQLIKDKTKVMLVIPTSQGNTAALSFAAAKDGTLSQISENPESSEILRSNNRNVLLPLNTLDEITAIGDSTPPPKGMISGMSRIDGDKVQISSENIQNLKSGDNIQIQGTRDYDGYHVARRIDNNTFEIEAKWVDSDGENNQNWLVGSWEVIPQEESGLVFDGIITAFEQTRDGKLRITSPNHGLESGDGVQILDTQNYDGIYPVTDIEGNNFTINLLWEPGLAANVKLESRKRRGISFDGEQDYIAIPTLELKPPSLSYSFGETYSAWIYVPESGAGEQLIIGEKGQLMQLTINNNRVVLTVLLDEGFAEIQDSNPVTAREWVHYAGIFSYNHKQKQTTLTLCRNGQQVTSKTLNNQNPQFSNEAWNPEFLIGGTAESNFFTGKIADVRVWNKARKSQEIEDSMYLQLSGKEAGLVGYWRLGAIVEEEQREVVDFSVYGNNGTVYGDPFVSAVTLERTLKDNATEVIRYTNRETFAVTQRATYVESFEFKLDNESINPNNVGGSKVFEFSYWGKANRNSEDIEEFSGVMENFHLENGWYKASARFTVPDDIKIVRSFELSNIKGNWKQLEIRKHRIQLISDAITEEKYTDEVELETLAAQSADFSQILTEISVKESQELKLINTITSLEQSPEEIQAKINDVQVVINRLETEEQSLRQTLDDARGDWKNYYQVIRNKKSGKALDVEDNSTSNGANIYQYDVHGGDNQQWRIIAEGGYYLIQSRRSGKYLNIHNASSSDGANLQQYQRNNRNNELWRLDGNRDSFYIINKNSDKVIDVAGKSTNNGANVHQWKKHSSRQDHQLWYREQSDEYCNNNIPGAEYNWNGKQTELNAKIAQRDRLIDERNADRTNLGNLKNQLDNLQEELKGLNNKLIKAVSEIQQSPQSMTELNQDQRELLTNGGILGFVNPISSLNAIETCEGNVQLSYFDDEGKMRQTNYDATADSRNASFEQWIPDKLPLCFKFSDNNSVNCGDNIELANSSFTVEFWAKRDEIANDNQFIISQGEAQKNKGLHIGFRSNGKFTFAFHTNDLDTEETYIDDLDWHYWCCVYDSENQRRRIYRDGEVAIDQIGVNEEYQGSGNFILGRYLNNSNYFTGKLAEVRIWNVALTVEEVAVNYKIRLSGNEPGLLAYYPLNELDAVRDYSGQNENASIAGVNNWWGCTAPIGKPKNSVTSNSLISCEYSTIGLDPATNQKSAVMRRFFAFISDDGVNILPDKRVETLELKWIGNAQFQPTLLGYIEGAPPVPSENLTLLDNYNSSTSVELVSSQDISYSWERTQDSGAGGTSSLFSGVKQKIDIQKGIGVSVGETALETTSGFQGNLSFSSNTINSSNVSSSSGLNITNKLNLVGTPEYKVKFPHLGKRFIPKNVGYALVVSGLADVYILRLTRSKQMVSYKIEPNEDIPLDVNTITFLINPSYTMNGSLDGMTGSNPSDDSSFQDVPQMRSQYGSLYPASYFRLSEAYQLKEQIDYRDSQRQAYFYQFNTLAVDEDSLNDEINNAENYSGETAVGQEDSTQQLDEEINQLKEEISELKSKLYSDGLSQEEVQTLNEKQDLLSEKQEQKQAALENKIEQLESLQTSTEDTAADQKKKEIQARFESTSQKIHATESFANWQTKMENIQILAGKRNIVNTYVWDADGGIYSESQQFANTFEHTLGGSFSLDTALGFQGGFKLFGVGNELQAQATVHLTQTMTKTETSSKGFELNINIAKLENRGITDSKDRPILPGEKVDRYRFMSFYLEGSSNNFNDFFDYVVDPEWLASNDEEARSLRQVDTSSPNKTWRILHRVTYVERPTLKS